MPSEPTDDDQPQPTDEVRQLAEFIAGTLNAHVQVHWLDVLARSPTDDELWDAAMDIAEDIDFDFEFSPDPPKLSV